jgi:hypothetical protein
MDTYLLLSVIMSKDNVDPTVCQEFVRKHYRSFRCFSTNPDYPLSPLYNCILCGNPVVRKFAYFVCFKCKIGYREFIRRGLDDEYDQLNQNIWFIGFPEYSSKWWLKEKLENVRLISFDMMKLKCALYYIQMGIYNLRLRRRLVVWTRLSNVISNELILMIISYL